MTYLYLFLMALPVMFVLDLLWIGVVANNFYKQQLGDLFSPVVHWPPALLFYLIYISGLVAFVIMPAIEAGSFWRAVVMGAFFGLVAYATYDLTSLSVIRNFPLVLSIVDMAWGVSLAAVVSGAVYLLATKVFGF